MIVHFSYYGTGGPDNGGLTSTGTGSFSFADGLRAHQLAVLHLASILGVPDEIVRDRF